MKASLVFRFVVSTCFNFFQRLSWMVPKELDFRLPANRCRASCQGNRNMTQCCAKEDPQRQHMHEANLLAMLNRFCTVPASLVKHNWMESKVKSIEQLVTLLSYTGHIWPPFFRPSKVELWFWLFTGSWSGSGWGAQLWAKLPPKKTRESDTNFDISYTWSICLAIFSHS